MNVESRVFGVYNGEEVKSHRLVNSNGVSVEMIDFGARLISVRTPDREGRIEEITLGFGTMEEYGNDRDYFGATAGRCANRIRDGQFEIDGVSYQLARNDGPNHLHGGIEGFDRRVWRSDTVSERGTGSVTFMRESPDGEEGYPGRVHAVVRYMLTEANELHVDFEVETDSPTLVNLTNHTFWNLSIGQGRGIRDHSVRIRYDHYLPVDTGLIPTGEILPVAGTAMDLRTPVSVGDALQAADGGFDHSYTFYNREPGIIEIARVEDPVTGRAFEVASTLPAVQFYTGNFLDGVQGRSAQRFEKHFGLCLEPHIHPDAVHHDHFPDVILRPGSQYTHRIVYRFGMQSEPEGTPI